jgi:prepilin-type N-terminal cleavage/methylation domain-containing protein
MARGYTLIEVMFVLGVCAVLSGAAVPQLAAGLDDIKTRAAARYLAARMQHTRTDAVRRNANLAVRFGGSGGLIRYGVYVDGNGNGVLSRDIADGVDRAVGREEAIDDQFPGVRFGALPGLPAVDVTATPPGTDPVRFGASDMAVFTSAGTATPGSVYLQGTGAQYVVRVFGDTGKVRVLKFDPVRRVWLSR